MNHDDAQGRVILELGLLDQATLSHAWRKPERLAAEDFAAFLESIGALDDTQATEVRALAATRPGRNIDSDAMSLLTKLLGPEGAGEWLAANHPTKLSGGRARGDGGPYKRCRGTPDPQTQRKPYESAALLPQLQATAWIAH